MLSERAIVRHDDTQFSDVVFLLYDGNIVWFVVCLWFQFFIVSITKGFKLISLQFHDVPCSPVIHWVKVFLEGHRVFSWLDVAANSCVIREAGGESLGYTLIYVADEYKDK